MGPTFVNSKWQESGLQLSQWMQEEQVTNSLNHSPYVSASLQYNSFFSNILFEYTGAEMDS